jgi:hypothetical protein
MPRGKASAFLFWRIAISPFEETLKTELSLMSIGRDMSASVRVV